MHTPIDIPVVYQLIQDYSTSKKSWLAKGMVRVIEIGSTYTAGILLVVHCVLAT